MVIKKKTGTESGFGFGSVLFYNSGSRSGQKPDRSETLSTYRVFLENRECVQGDEPEEMYIERFEEQRRRLEDKGVKASGLMWSLNLLHGSNLREQVK